MKRNLPAVSVLKRLPHPREHLRNRRIGHVSIARQAKARDDCFRLAAHIVDVETSLLGETRGGRSAQEPHLVAVTHPSLDTQKPRRHQRPLLPNPDHAGLLNDEPASESFSGVSYLHRGPGLP